MLCAEALSRIGPNAKGATSHGQIQRVCLQGGQARLFPPRDDGCLPFEAFDAETALEPCKDALSRNGPERWRVVASLVDAAADDPEIVTLLAECAQEHLLEFARAAAQGLSKTAVRFPELGRGLLQGLLSSRDTSIAAWAALGLHTLEPDNPEWIPPLLGFQVSCTGLPGPRPEVEVGRLLPALGRQHRGTLERLAAGPDAWAGVRAARALLLADPGCVLAQETLVRYWDNHAQHAGFEIGNALVSLESGSLWAREAFTARLKGPGPICDKFEWDALERMALDNISGKGWDDLPTNPSFRHGIRYLHLEPSAGIHLHSGHAGFVQRLATESADADHRCFAAWALGSLNVPPRQVVPQLVSLLQDRDPLVRDLAFRSLSRLALHGTGAPALIARAVERGTADVFALRLLRGAGEDALPHLERLLDHANPELRSEAAWALGKLYEVASSAVPVLTRVLASDPDTITRWNAAEALGRIGAGARAALPELENLAAGGNADLARAARGAIRRITR
jgi:HEAT repeat protein